MAARQVRSGKGRRLFRLSPALAAIAGLAVVVGPPRAGLLVAAAVMTWGLARWSRLEARLFDPRPQSAVPLRPEVWSRPVDPAAGTVQGVEVHRAYARALHAVTGAYLAECERDAPR